MDTQTEGREMNPDNMPTKKDEDEEWAGEDEREGYQIARSFDISRLAGAVRRQMRKGWEPLGGPVYEGAWHQAMVRATSNVKVVVNGISESMGREIARLTEDTE